MSSAAEERIQKQIVDFFSYFEEISLAAEASAQRALRTAQSLLNLLRRYRLTRGANLQGTPLNDIRDTLLVKLDGIINKHVLAIQEELKKLNEQQEKLSNKYNNLQSGCKQVDFKQQTTLVQGSCHQPPLALLLEYAFDATNHIFQVCTQFDIAVEELAIQGPDTPDRLVDYFVVPKEWKSRVAEITRFTSYCSENTL